MLAQTAEGENRILRRASRRAKQKKHLAWRALIVGCGLSLAAATGSSHDDAQSEREAAKNYPSGAQPVESLLDETQPIDVAVLGTTESSSQTSTSTARPLDDGCLSLQDNPATPSASEFVNLWNSLIEGQANLCEPVPFELDAKSWTIDGTGPRHIGEFGSQFGLISSNDVIERVHFALLSTDTQAGAHRTVHRLVSSILGVTELDPNWSTPSCESRIRWSGHLHESSSGGSSLSVDFC